jgi:hypothetical protein
VRQAADLWQIKQLLQALLARLLAAFVATVHVVDAFPVRVCRLARANRCRRFAGEAALGYCATLREYYYGFKGHLLISDEGVITACSLTAANVDDREAIEDLLDQIVGVIIGDKGYLDRDLFEQLGRRGLCLKTPLRKNMAPQPDAAAMPRQRIRRKLVETVISQLQDYFRIHMIHARDTWHLTSRVARKLLAHTLCCFLNLAHGREPLHFEGLVDAA